MKESPLAAREAAQPFLETLKCIPESLAQARLLNTADRDLGVILHALDEEGRADVYRIVGARKAERLREEVERMGHVSLDPHIVGSIAAHLASHLSGNRPIGPASRFFRPRRK